MEIFQKCVLWVLDAKCLKTNEKWTKFAQLAVSVPQLSKVVKTSPWTFQKKQNMQNIIKGPWGFISCQNKSFEYQKSQIYNFGPTSLKNVKNSPWWI